MLPPPLPGEGVPISGHVESPEWIYLKRGGHTLKFDAVWSHDGQEYRREFKIPRAEGSKHVDEAGTIFQPQIAMHYVPSKPSVGWVDVYPRDPWWGGLIIACVGFIILCGVVYFLIQEWRPTLFGDRPPSFAFAFTKTLGGERGRTHQ